MLINLFLKNKLTYRDVDLYQSGVGFVIALHTIYTLKYYENLDTLSFIILAQLSIDSFFTNIDQLIHHLSVIMLATFVYNYNISIDHRNILYRTILPVEVSSIFLSLRPFFNMYRKKLKNRPYTEDIHQQALIIKKLENINNMVFVITFIKFRIYDYYVDIINGHEFNEIIYYYAESDILSNAYFYSGIYTLYGLNLYWFSKILRILYKMIA